ncbi:MAG: hypothetical protein U9R20_03575 [Thermodesulfobacteriota bacterium]|nr:hypothetical protein [Thermodesulfobacteriota bacterium]
MSKNQSYAWEAMCEIVDYFSCMGGTGRPSNMAESEIPLYVACKLIELHDDLFNSDEYIDRVFAEAAAPVIERANSYLSKVSVPFAELIPFVLDFYEYADKKLKPIDKTTRWNAFGTYLKERNA